MTFTVGNYDVNEILVSFIVIIDVLSQRLTEQTVLEDLEVAVFTFETSKSIACSLYQKST